MNMCVQMRLNDDGELIPCQDPGLMRDVVVLEKPQHPGRSRGTE